MVLPTTKSGAEKRSVTLEPGDAGWLGGTFEKENDLMGPASRSCNQAVTAENNVDGGERGPAGGARGQAWCRGTNWLEHRG